MKDYAIDRELTEKEAEILIIYAKSAGVFVHDMIESRFQIEQFPYYAIKNNSITRYHKKPDEVRDKFKIVTWKQLLSQLRKETNEQSRDTIKETN